MGSLQKPIWLSRKREEGGELDREEADVRWKVVTAVAVLIALATLAQGLRVFG